MNIDYLYLPSENRLIEDFYQQFDSSFVSTLFSYNPWDGKSYERRYQILQERREEKLSRSELVQAFRSQYGHAKLHPQVERNLQRLEDQRSCVVIGGQQAGLLTGPLYTIYKAITIIQLAQREEKRLGVPVVPVFWIAGEDHDFEEVNHIWVRDLQGDIKKLSFQRRSSTTLNRYSVSSLPLDRPAMLQWLEQLSHQLPDTPYKVEWLQVSQTIVSSAKTWGQFFFEMMQMLFNRWGLLLIDSTNLVLRRLESKFFIRLIERNQQLREWFGKTEQSCKENQYQTPVKLEENHAHLFINIQGERYPLFNYQDIWMTRDGLYRWSTKELLRIAEETPERLSNNVLTRPLMQEYLFPTLASVCGSNEIAYWSLLRQAFALMDLEMPIVYPRTQITLVDPTSFKRMRRFQFTWEDLFFHFERKKEDWLNQKVEVDIDQLFQRANQDMEQIHQALVDQLEQHLHLQIHVIGKKNREKIKAQMDYLRKFVKQMVEQRFAIELRRMDELKTRLLPLQKPQERVYNFFQLWNNYGRKWFEQLVELPLLQKPSHHHLIQF